MRRLEHLDMVAELLAELVAGSVVAVVARSASV